MAPTARCGPARGANQLEERDVEQDAAPLRRSTAWGSVYVPMERSSADGSIAPFHFVCQGHSNAPGDAYPDPDSPVAFPALLHGAYHIEHSDATVFVLGGDRAAAGRLRSKSPPEWTIHAKRIDAAIRQRDTGRGLW